MEDGTPERAGFHPERVVAKGKRSFGRERRWFYYFLDNLLSRTMCASLVHNNDVFQFDCERADSIERTEC